MYHLAIFPCGFSEHQQNRLKIFSALFVTIWIHMVPVTSSMSATGSALSSSLRKQLIGCSEGQSSIQDSYICKRYMWLINGCAFSGSTSIEWPMGPSAWLLSILSTLPLIHFCTISGFLYLFIAAGDTRYICRTLVPDQCLPQTGTCRRIV